VTEPLWLPIDIVERWHERLLARDGGIRGIRDRGLLESALARPRTIHVYAPQTPLAALAAAYAYGLSRNHPFLDGNKRIAFATMVSFLRANGLTVETDEDDATTMMLAVAAGDADEAMLTGWLLSRTR
jgi:death-on-curing protein